MIVLLTGKDQLEYDMKTIDDFRNEAPKYMKPMLISKEIPVIAFNNRARDSENVLQVAALLEQVDLCVASKKPAERYLSNARLLAAEKIMQEAEAKMD